MSGSFLSGGHGLVIAHRGFHPGEHPFENTVASGTAAIDLGADAVEMDVRRTRDGVLVIHHDPDVGGVTIANTDFANLPPAGNGFAVPTLQDMITLARTRNAHLVVELKEPGYEKDVVDALATQLPVSQFELTSFNSPSIKAVESYHPEIRTGVLAPRIYPWLRQSFAWPVIEKLLEPLHLSRHRVEKAGADYMAIDQQGASSSVLNDAARHGIQVDVWTVDDPARINQLLADPRVHGVITNRTDIALALRARQHLAPLGAAAQQTGLGALAAQPH